METSKLYKQLGNKVGIKQVRFSHRGIIARLIIKHINRLELNEFSASMKRINLSIKGIKVYDNGKTYYI